MMKKRRDLSNAFLFTVMLLVTPAVWHPCWCKQAPSGWIEDAPQQAQPSGPLAPQQAKIDATTGSAVGASGASQSAALAAPNGGANGKRVLLQGGVEHSQSLPPLPNALSVGSTFNRALLKGSPPIDGWYWIPDWLAGDWRRDEETIVSSYDYRTQDENNEPHTIVATEIAQFGVQRDRFGGIWHCRLAANGMADCGDYFSVALVQSQEPEVVSQDKVIIKDVFTELHVNKETNAIIYAAQAESLTRYRPERDGVLNSKVSVKFFDQSGMALKGQRNQSFVVLTKPFVPVDSYKGMDLRSLFKQFLISNGKADYAPQ
jgi:hypothetical protein